MTATPDALAGGATCRPDAGPSVIDSLFDSPVDSLVDSAVELHIAFDRDGLHRLREAVAAYGVALGLSQRRAEHLVLVAHELAANAIRHGGGTGQLRLWRDPTTVYCQVSDHGPGVVDPTMGMTPPAFAATGGRGLWICRQLCDHLTIDPPAGGSGTTITAMIAISTIGRHRPRQQPHGTSRR